MSKASPARTKALEACAVIRSRDAFARDVIDKVIDTSNLDVHDRAFATRLVLGVVQMRGTLDLILDKAMRSPDDVKPDVRDALRISTYEIVFLQKSPHAAVDQGVELVRSVAPKAGGLANAVLRKVVALKASFPFGDPKKDIEAYAILHGFPVWLTKKFISDLGATKAHDLIVASNEPAPLFIAVNSLKASDSEILNLLKEAKGAPTFGEVNDVVLPGCYRLGNTHALNDGRVRHAIGQGKLLVSDAASQAVALVTSSFEAESVLEIGAGRGTKTILIQSDSFRRSGTQIKEFVSVDNLAFKTRLLKNRANSYGVNVSNALTCDATDMKKALNGKQFDTVFIDAPCTGLGTLRRHPEIRWRVQSVDIERHAQLDVELLKEASQYVKQGGVLVYATCTVTHEENEGAIASFLDSQEGREFNRSGGLRTYLAPHGCDAHFCSVLKHV